MLKKVFAFFLASFLFSQTASAQVYVALGDSLAAGQTPYTQIDAGYTDFIALQLAAHNQLTHFSKELTFPGYTVADVLERVQHNATQLQAATLITISAGANNLLPLVSHNPEKGTIQFSQVTANFALNRVRLDMGALLAELKRKAPKATVYVLGYYFPYTSVHEAQKAGIATQLTLLNTILEQVAHEAGAIFVPIAFAQPREYLPNVRDVHPNQLGYLQMANAVLKKYGLPLMSATQLPEPNPLTFQEILEQQPIQEGVVTVKPIEEFAVFYGYERFKRFFL